MKIGKKILAQMNNPYAPCVLDLDGEQVFIVAPVDHGNCLVFFPPYDKSIILWNESGTMNIVRVPCEKNMFLSTRNFFQQFNAPHSNVSLIEYDSSSETKFMCKNVLELAYLHRFSVVSSEFGRFFVGSSLCEKKESKDDWSTPGSVYAADLTGGLFFENWHVEKIIDGIYKNHGFFSTIWKGVHTIFVSGVEGVFSIQITDKSPRQWKIQHVLEVEASDIYVYDIDGDGTDELITIEGFHGDYLNVYRETENGFEREYILRTPQGHSLWAGKIFGERVIIEGYCHEDSRLIMLRRKDSLNLDFNVETIDTNVGPRNFTVFDDNGVKSILSANWGAGEIGLYKIESLED